MAEITEFSLTGRGQALAAVEPEVVAELAGLSEIELAYAGHVFGSIAALGGVEFAETPQQPTAQDLAIRDLHEATAQLEPLDDAAYEAMRAELPTVDVPALVAATEDLQLDTGMAIDPQQIDAELGEL